MSALDTLASIIGWVVIIAGGWYALGFAFNSLVVYPIAARCAPWKRVIIEPYPRWYEPIKYLACGPVGWFAWVIDHRATKRSREAMERMRKRRAQEREW